MQTKQTNALLIMILPSMILPHSAFLSAVHSLGIPINFNVTGNLR
jgi:hypothetical protein